MACKKKLIWNEESIDGLRLKWRQAKRLHIELQSDSMGWIAIGFNKSPQLAGTRLFMINHVDGKTHAEEHLAAPPNHAAILDQSAVQDLQGSQVDGKTTASFSLPIENLGNHVTLAWSVSNDLQHHSRNRKMITLDLIH